MTNINERQRLEAELSVLSAKLEGEKAKPREERFPGILSSLAGQIQGVKRRLRRFGPDDIDGEPQVYEEVF